jgi:FG-GAP-like repeat
MKPAYLNGLPNWNKLGRSIAGLFCFFGAAFHCPHLAFAATAVTFPTFFLKSYGGRCLDVGANPRVGSPAVLADCNGALAQQIGIQELRSGSTGPFPLEPHGVLLRAAAFCIEAKGNPPAPGSTLVLEHCTGSAGQQFVLDGDSIIVAANRALVVQPQGARGANGTLITLGPRILGDAEFWDFRPIDERPKALTTGFTTVSCTEADPVTCEDQLRQALQSGPDTVVIFDGAVNFDFAVLFADQKGPILVPDRVTLRGGRRFTDLGPQIKLTQNPPQGQPGLSLFQTTGNNVRITGLRLHGPGRDPDGSNVGVSGVLADDQFTAIIDHNDLSDWTTAAVNVVGPVADDLKCQLPTASSPKVLVTRNFIHDNEEVNDGLAGYGYGVASGSDAYPQIEANTFLANIHSITADGYALTGYLADGNLFLSKSIKHSGGVVDMHGQTGDPNDHHHVGGIAGTSLEVAHNTFLGTEHANFDLRGYPCPCAMDRFHDNISLRNLQDTISWYPGWNYFLPPIVLPLPPWLQVYGTFEAQNPTQQLGVGDFDGDGKDDLFMATGEAWYYAPGGAAEWRFLSYKTEPIGQLLFGDFDGDGRTDVFTQQGNDWMVSWGGISDWEKINESESRMTDFFIGDFVGDRRADVFFARGDQWFVSDGGVGPFVPYATSSYKKPDLRFGDFDGDGKTDVMSVVADQWMAVFASDPEHKWRLLRPKLTDRVEGLIVANFDGKGHDDIARLVPVQGGASYELQVSFEGTNDWQTLRTLPPSLAALGRFDDQPGADLLFWTDNYLQIISSGTGALQRHSRQDMR